MRDSVHVRTLSREDFTIAAADRVRMIGVDPERLVTRSLVVDPACSDGHSVADPERDIAKIAVVERHGGTGGIGLGFVTGFGLRRGALASSHAHDAHNIVVVGVDDDDMAIAVNRLAGRGGGQVVVSGGGVLAELPCPVGGLLSDRSAAEVAREAVALDRAAGELGTTFPKPFMAMSFLALSVIPALRLTDRGLVDVDRFELVDLAVE
jgi:adenine deaminase